MSKIQTQAFMLTFVGLTLLACQLVGQSVDDQYRLAAGHYARKDWNAAVTAFDEIIESYPDSKQARLAFFFKGEAYIQAGNYDDAFSEFENYLRAPVENKHVKRAEFRRAESAFFSKDANVALGHLKNFARGYKSDPYNEFVLAYLGQLYLKTNQPQLAKESYEAGLEQFPGSPLADKNRLGLGQSLQLLKQYDQAQQVFETVAESKSRYAARARLALGHLHFHNRQYQQAAAAYQKILDENPTNANRINITYWLGRSQMALGSWEQAARTISTVADSKISEPLGSAIFYDAAVCWIKSNEIDKAARLLRQLRNQWPNSRWSDDALQLLVDIASRQNIHDQVIDLGSEFQTKHADSEWLPRVVQLVGRSYYEKRDYHQSQKYFRRLLDGEIKSNPETKNKYESDWRYLLAVSQIGLKKFEPALLQLNRIETDTSAKQEFVAAIALAKATANIGLSKNLAAAENYEQYLTILPTGSYANRSLSDLAIVYAKTDQLDKSAESIQRLQMLEPESPLLLPAAEALAEAAYKNKKYEIAQKNYLRLAEGSLDKSTQLNGLIGLFWVYQKQNQVEAREIVLKKLITDFATEVRTATAALAAAKADLNANNQTRAAQRLEWIIEHHQKSTPAQLATIELAVQLRKIGDETSIRRAREILTQLISDAPTGESTDAALYELAWLELKADDTESAVAQFEKLASDFPTSKFRDDAQLRLTNIAFDAQDFRRAAELGLQLDQSRPTNREIGDHALLIAGKSNCKTKKWRTAEDQLILVLRRTKDEKIRESAAHWLAESIAGDPDPAAAFDHFLIQQKGFNSFAAKWIPSVNLRVCQILAERNNLTLASKIAGKTEKRFQNFEQRYELDYIIGRAHADKAEFTEARQRYQKVIDSKSGNATETAAKAQWMIGETYFHQEHYAEAVDAYYRVDSLFDYKQWRAAALLQAAKCQEQLRNVKQAMSLYRQVIDLLPHSEYATQAQDRLNLLLQQAKKKANAIRNP